MSAIVRYNPGLPSQFKAISVSGQSDVVADSLNDTLTLAGISNVQITTNAGTDTISVGVNEDPTFHAVTVNGDGDDVNLLALTNSHFNSRLSLDNTATSGREYRIISTGTGSAITAGSLAFYDADATAVRLRIADDGTVYVVGTLNANAIAVTSTSVVTNLNADQLDGQHGSHYLDWTNTTNKPSPKITLGGDLTGDVTLADLASGTLTATIAADSVALGTDTTGNYIATIAGTTDEIDVSGSGEGAAITLSLPATINANTTGSAAKWTTSRTIDLTGDVTGTATSVDGSANVSIATTIAANSVALGTDTTGNYVATVAGTTDQVSVSGSGSETAAITLSLPQDINTTSSPSFTGLTLSGDLAVNGADITTTSVGTATVFNTNATTVNIAGAATTVSIGASNGTTTINGNLTVNGTTTTVNATTVSVDDKNIELGSVASPTDVTADGGGITLKGATDKTLNWVDATDSWTSNQDFDLASGKVYRINGTQILSSTTLASSVTSALGLISVGIIGTGTWQGAVIAGAYGGTGVANTGKTITLGGNVTTTGAYAIELILSAATSVTMPIGGKVVSDTTTNLISDNDQLILASQIFGR